MSTGIIIQARIGSTRLPGKVLLPIGDLPLLGHVIGRLELLKSPVKTVIATSTLTRDDAIADWCAANNVTCFRGDENDVLDRYMECASSFGFSNIVRLTADNPFTDMEELDRLIELHLIEKNDYTHSFGELPIGVGTEIFTMKALKQSHAEGHAPNHREHVNEYIQENPQIFKIGMLRIQLKKFRPQLRLTVDTQEDLNRAIFLVQNKTGKWITTEQAISLCSRSA